MMLGETALISWRQFLEKNSSVFGNQHAQPLREWVPGSRPEDRAAYHTIHDSPPLIHSELLASYNKFSYSRIWVGLFSWGKLMRGRSVGWTQSSPWQLVSRCKWNSQLPSSTTCSRVPLPSASASAGLGSFLRGLSELVLHCYPSVLPLSDPWPTCRGGKIFLYLSRSFWLIY